MRTLIIPFLFLLVMMSCSSSHTGDNNDNNTYGSSELAHIKWKFKTESVITSSPTVANGIVFFGSSSFGTSDNYMYAVDINTGEEKWKFKTANYIASSPTVSNGLVFFGSYNYLYAVDAKTGQEEWKFKTEEIPTSSPVVSNGLVFFGSWDNYLYAVDVKTRPFETAGIEDGLLLVFNFHFSCLVFISTA